MLSPLAKPRVDTDLGDGRTAFTVDERTVGQRMHDALGEVCDRILRAGGLPDSGGTPATVIVTIDLDNLLDSLGYGTTSDGTLLSTAEVLKLAGEADIIPAVLTRTGALLDLGRTRRVATASQTYGLIARDGGCSFPGCAAPPEWCERHHIISWLAGGNTSLNNLTLLCRYHHHNFLARGWDCLLNSDGLPTWIPPVWIDPQRKPLLNNRILERLAAQRHLRTGSGRAVPWVELSTTGAADLMSAPA